MATNKEFLIHNGKEYECFPESDYKVWIHGYIISILDCSEVIFRGWKCTVYSSTIHFDTVCSELLLRRDAKI